MWLTSKTTHEACLFVKDNFLVFQLDGCLDQFWVSGNDMFILIDIIVCVCVCKIKLKEISENLRNLH